MSQQSDIVKDLHMFTTGLELTRVLSLLYTSLKNHLQSDSSHCIRFWTLMVHWMLLENESSCPNWKLCISPYSKIIFKVIFLIASDFGHLWCTGCFRRRNLPVQSKLEIHSPYSEIFVCCSHLEDCCMPVQEEEICTQFSKQLVIMQISNHWGLLEEQYKKLKMLKKSLFHKSWGNQIRLFVHLHYLESAFVSKTQGKLHTVNQYSQPASRPISSVIGLGLWKIKQVKIWNKAY